MHRFHIVDDAAVILRSKGVYRQAKVYRRGDDLYAGFGAGFIGLRRNGGTTLPSVSWEDIEAPFAVRYSGVGIATVVSEAAETTVSRRRARG